MPCQTLFQHKHELYYGLNFAKIDPFTSRAVPVPCQFCVFFGREEKVGAKQKTSSLVEYFKSPFCVEGFCQHLEGQHGSHWDKYKKLDKEKASTYFLDASEVPIKNTVRAYFGDSQAPLIEDVDASIVDVLIVEMLFDSDTEESTMHNALKPFVTQGGLEEDGSKKIGTRLH